LYLDDLKKNLPNWGLTLENLLKSYQENLPKTGTNLSSLGYKICLFEMRKPSGNLNPFLNLNSSLGVQHTNFEKAKEEIESAFQEVKEVLQQPDGAASLPSGISAKVNKAFNYPF
jgi:hypothetical protein